MKLFQRTFAAGAVVSTLFAVAAADESGAAQAAELTISVSGVKSGKGRIFVALHRAAAGVKFPDMKGAVAGAWRKAQKGGFSVTFDGLEPGRYAVNGFHDANGDGKLDTNLLGIPTEGYGFGQWRDRQLRPSGIRGFQHRRRRQGRDPAAHRLLSLSPCSNRKESL